MKKQEKEELDLFYCMGLSQSKQTNIKDLILNLKDYLGSEYRVATQEYFNDFNNLIPKCSELGSHKEKNVLGKDIQQIMKEYGDKCNLQVIR